MNAPLKRSTPLTPSEIAGAALAMVDRDGVAMFSMRRLADALGVTPMAVYHHFENKTEILQAAADQVWIEAALALRPADDPVEDLIQSMLTIRRTFLAHAEVTAYAIASPTTEDAVHVAALAVVERFERAGFRGAAVGRAYHALATYTLGSALLHADRTILDRAIRHPVSELAALAPERVGESSDPGEAYRAVRAAMGSDPDLARFEQGLRDITAGLRHELLEQDGVSG